MLIIRYGLSLLFVLSVLLASGCAGPGNGKTLTTPVAQSGLGPYLYPDFQSEVLVLGTMHLAAYNEQLTTAHLVSVLDALEHYAPSRIGVELLPADELALLREHAAHDPAAAELLGMFGKRIVTLGDTMQKALQLSRTQANQHARSMLPDAATLSADDRALLVGLLLAAYEYPSALLQWSYLPESLREDDSRWPAHVREQLRKALASANEVSTLAVPLARRLGLQQIHAIDSQYEGIRTLAAPRAALEDLFSDPRRSEWRTAERVRGDENLRQNAFAAGDLLPLYQWLNSHEYMTWDVEQWRWLFETRHASGLDRFRYAMWELRNQRIATNIVDAAASTRPERLVVIIGSAHKAALDESLSQLLSVRLRQFNELPAR